MIKVPVRRMSQLISVHISSRHLVTRLLLMLLLLLIVVIVVLLLWLLMLRLWDLLLLLGRRLHDMRRLRRPWLTRDWRGRLVISAHWIGVPMTWVHERLVLRRVRRKRRRHADGVPILLRLLRERHLHLMRRRLQRGLLRVRRPPIVGRVVHLMWRRIGFRARGCGGVGIVVQWHWRG